MSEWREVRLIDIAEVNPKESLSKGVLASKIGMEHLKPFCKKIIDKVAELYNGGAKFRNGDTLVARITPCLENGKTAFVDILDDNEIGFGSTEYIVLRAKNNISDSHYIYYFSRSDLFREVAIASMTGSSGRQRVQIDVVKNHLFELPDIFEQQAIASVLSSLDDKVDLLHRQNQTLESMAETLFRRWFVEEAQDNWEEVKVRHFVTLNKSSITKKYDYQSILYLDTSSLTKGYISELKPLILSEAPSRAKRLVQHLDILISTVRPDQCHYGFCLEPEANLVVSTGFCTITCDTITPFFIYYLLTSEDMTEYLHSIAEGSTSTYPSLKPEDIGNVSFLIPPREKLNNFHDQIGVMWNKINQNQKQIQTLEKLRDALLPKLMSGEVHVDYTPEEIKQ